MSQDARAAENDRSEASASRPSRRPRDAIAAGQLRIDSQRDGAVHTIQLSGELDIASADRVQLEIERAAAEDASAIVVDLADLMFIDSCGLRALLLASQRVRGQPGRLTIRRAQRAVQRVFEISGLSGFLPLSD